MEEIKFQAWPKTPRLMKDMIITEKIDGTNGAVIVTEDGQVSAQSRKRLLGPVNKMDARGAVMDNAGFYAWVDEHREALAELLGPGHHYGEWYGHRINRGYGLTGRRFALFNVNRYAHVVNDPTDVLVPGLETVPVLYTGLFDTRMIRYVYDDLMKNGSVAVPGFMRPEGVIVYHTASQQVYKYLGLDDRPKSQIAALAVAA